MNKAINIYKFFVNYHLKRTGGVEIRLFLNNKRLINNIFVNSLIDFENIISKNKGKDIIFTINKPKTKGNKLKDEDFEKYLYVFLDLDFKDHTDEEKIFFSKEVLEQVLYEENIHYCYKAKGRGGYHYLIPIDLEVSNDNKERIKKLLEELEIKCIDKIKNYYHRTDYDKFMGIIDKVVTNPSRLIRCPNTYNYKDKKPVLNEIVEFFEISDEKIKINTNFVKKIKIINKPKKIKNLKRFNNLGRDFFQIILTNDKIWDDLKSDWENADERYTVFVKNLGAYVKHNPDYLDNAYAFLDYLGYLKQRKSQIKHYLEKDNNIDNVNINEIKKWIKKYKLSNFWEVFNKLSQPKIFYKKDGILKIEYNPELDVYNAFYHKTRGDYCYWEIFGSYKNILKFKRIIYNVNSKILKNEQEIVKITNIHSTKEEDRVKEFNLQNSEYIAIGKFIKFGNQRDQVLVDAYLEFYNFLNSDLIPTKEEVITDCYGVFDENNVLLPDKVKLIDTVDKEGEISNFEEHITNTDKLDINQVKEVAINLKEYIKLSKASTILFCYTLVSPFRYYLMNKGLKEFGFLGIKGRSSIGKTTRIKILNNLFHTGYNFEGYTQVDINRVFIVNLKQHLLTPMVFEDPNLIRNELVSILKSLGTSKVIDNERGTANQKTKKYKFIRPIILSFNNLNITDEYLIQRFIFLDLNDINIKRDEIIPKEDLINYLINNVHLLGKFYWKNIDKFFDVFKDFNMNEIPRENSKVVILEMGFKIMNQLFKQLNIDPIENIEFEQYLTDGKNLIYNETDKIKIEILKALKELTTIKSTEREDNKLYNETYDFTNLNNPDLDEKIKEKIIKKGEDKGIYLHKEGILITRTALSHIKTKLNVEFKLNSTTDLQYAFEEGEYEIINTGYKRKQISINGIHKCGFLILYNRQDEDPKNKLISLKSMIHSYIEEYIELNKEINIDKNLQNLKGLVQQLLFENDKINPDIIDFNDDLFDE